MIGGKLVDILTRQENFFAHRPQFTRVAACGCAFVTPFACAAPSAALECCLPVTVQRFEETINGREYRIEVSAVGSNRGARRSPGAWRIPRDDALLRPHARRSRPAPEPLADAQSRQDRPLRYSGAMRAPPALAALLLTLALRGSVRSRASAAQPPRDARRPPTPRAFGSSPPAARSPTRTAAGSRPRNSSASCRTSGATRSREFEQFTNLASSPAHARPVAGDSQAHQPAVQGRRRPRRRRRHQRHRHARRARLLPRPHRPLRQAGRGRRLDAQPEHARLRGRREPARGLPRRGGPGGARHAA